jgi:hypothetical protein
MPEEVTQKVLTIREKADLTKYQKQMNQLTRHSEWEKGLEELKNTVPEDKDGFIMLTCMLIAGLTTYENYAKKGVSEEIFFDTFGCFSRFVKEHMVSFVKYGFDRDFWTPRQLAMDLFRLGTLEFELYTDDDLELLSIHIPSDAALTMENCRKSYDLAKEFFPKYYPDFHYEKFVCESWLLSPYLKELLPEHSHIIRFQNSFVIEGVDLKSRDYMEWVFKNRNLSIDEVPQETSLQRRMKEYIKKGGVIGNGAGYLKPDPFR